MKTVVTIPIYKKIPDNLEEASLLNCFRILNNRHFCFVAPKSLDISYYKNLASANNINADFEFFDDKDFISIQSYSKLLLSVDFYERFKNFDFMFLFQLDGWIFRDELDIWCNKDYDYIGAPWFIKDTNQMLSPSGNGGVSLRKISTFISILKNKKLSAIFSIKKDKKLAYNIFNYIKFTLPKMPSKVPNEDYVVVNFFPCIDKNFKIAPNEINLKFSFEVNPEILYKLNNKTLPFACHGFMRHGKDFWVDFIEPLKSFDK